MAENKQEREESSWIALRKELRKRTFEPASHASFVMYFLFAVVVFGGAGIWVEGHSYIWYVETVENPHHSASALRTAVLTFFPALAGSACMQLIWADDIFKPLRSFAMCVLVALVALIFVVAPSVVSNTVALLAGVFASMIALWTWWIANARQRDLLDIDIDAPTGKKDTSGELAGDLGGFKT